MHRIINWNELWKAIYINSPERLDKSRDPAPGTDAAAYRRVTRGEKEATSWNLRS